MTVQLGTFEFLGTGASMGVPVIGCDCVVCCSLNVHNTRLRPSALLTISGKQFLIDCGPDFKQQALKIHLKKIDGVLFTHAHNDHIAGIDDLRTLVKSKTAKIPCLLSTSSAEEIKKRFSYIFENEIAPGKFITQLEMKALEGQAGHVNFEGIPIQYCSYDQMGMPVNGFRFGNLAYLTDIRNYSEGIFEMLKGVDILIVSALRHTPSPMHFTVDEAVDFISKTNAQAVYFTHLSHELEHEETNAYLPSHCKLAYDGLKLEFNI